MLDDSNPGGFAPVMFDGLWWILGGAFTIDKICVQQLLPCRYQNGTFLGIIWKAMQIVDMFVRGGWAIDSGQELLHDS